MTFSHRPVWLLVNFTLLALALGVCPCARALAPQQVVEYRLKAAYLYNFLKFIEWPPGAQEPSGPFVIGVLDPEGSAAALIQETLQAKTAAGGRLIEVRVFTRLSPAVRACHQVFVTQAAGLSPMDLAALTRDTSLLVVGETERFAAQGGAIGLVVSGDAVRCEINLAGAQRAGVRLSGRLASVARLVREVERS